MSDEKKYNRIVHDNYSWFDKDKLIDPRDNYRKRYVIEIIKGLGKGLRVLDVGCGNGDFAVELSNMGYIVVGMDVSSEAIKIAEHNNIKRVDNKKISFYSFNINNPEKELMNRFNDYFDVIIMMDVLEHINDDYNALKTINCLLYRYGHLIISVPNNPFYWNNLDVLTGHYRRYTKKTVRSLLHNNDFVVEIMMIVGFPFNTLLMFIQSMLSNNKDSAYIPKNGVMKKFYKIFYPLINLLFNVDKLFDFTNLGYEIIIKAKRIDNDE